MNNFENNVKDLQSNLLSYAFILTSNRDNAYSLLSDTTATVLASPEALTPEVSFKDWAFGIMKAIYNSKYSRKHSDVKVGSLRKYAYHINVSDEKPETECNTEVCELSDAINSLENIYRAPYILFVTGYSVEQIAVRLAIPQITVSARVHYAEHMMAKRSYKTA